MLPYGESRLCLFDQRRACPKGLTSVGSTHGNRQGTVADPEGSDAVRHRNGDDIKSTGDIGRDLSEDGPRGGMALIDQAVD